MKAVVIGGSGATGMALINQLLSDNSYTKIVSLVRKQSNIKHHKLNEIIIDFNNLDNFKNDIIADVAFSCLGTTLKAAGSKKKQWKIDYEYQYEFARMAKENGIEQFVLVSSVGANSKSNFFYTKMKGQLEESILKLDFKQTIIFQPPSLIRPNTDRKGEKLMINLLNVLNSMGLFKSLKPLPVSDLAEAMILSLVELPEGKHILKPFDIKNKFFLSH